jgi:homoserine dehydrogenase
MHRSRVVVLKFGSSVLRSESDLPRAVHEIYRWLRQGYSVAAVVSAFGETTNELLATAKQYAEQPPDGALALLLSTGEKRAAALLALALDRAGIPATAFDPARLGLRTSGRLLNAEPIRLNVNAVRQALQDGRVAVVPGFIGQTQDGRTSLLGRGGSDLSALFLTVQLGARCRLLKDVDGVYERDPHLGTGRRYESLTWEDALALGGRIVQGKALRFAREHHQKFEVAGIGADVGTWIGALQTSFSDHREPMRPVKVALLGLGTAGYGVYQELAAHPELFEVVGIAVRNVQRRENSVLRHLLSTDAREVATRDSDVVIELIGGLDPASDCIADALKTGKHVITANKTALAENRSLLRFCEIHPAKAAKAGTIFSRFQTSQPRPGRLLYSAAVGGAVPVLERLEQLAGGPGIDSVEGVLNGTTNFILHEVARGAPFDQALGDAQACGLAEADPSADLDGSDVGCKLVLMARAAFGEDISLNRVQRTGIRDIDPRHIFDLSKSGLAVRLVGSLRREHGTVIAEVKPQVLPPSSPLAGTLREENCVVIKTLDGETHVLSGKGAGRWPTTESVLGDLFTLIAESRSQFSQPPSADELAAVAS